MVTKIGRITQLRLSSSHTNITVLNKTFGERATREAKWPAVTQTPNKDGREPWWRGQEEGGGEMATKSRKKPLTITDNERRGLVLKCKPRFLSKPPLFHLPWPPRKTCEKGRGQEGGERNRVGTEPSKSRKYPGTRPELWKLPFRH